MAMTMSTTTKNMFTTSRTIAHPATTTGEVVNPWYCITGMVMSSTAITSLPITSATASAMAAR